MADVRLLAPILLQWEGGFVDDPLDSGGATNMGVTLSTWRKVGYDKDGDGEITASDLKLLTKDDVINRVLKPHYWDRWMADKINNQSVANLLVDWVYNSGVHGIKIPQRLLGVAQDGIVGDITIAAVNNANQNELFGAIWSARKSFYYNIVKKSPNQRRFLNGWLNRLNAYKYYETQ